MSERLEKAVTEDLRFALFVAFELMSVLDKSLKSLNLVGRHNG
jgi:hypothetical protein